MQCSLRTSPIMYASLVSRRSAVCLVLVSSLLDNPSPRAQIEEDRKSPRACRHVPRNQRHQVPIIRSLSNIHRSVIFLEKETSLLTFESAGNTELSLALCTTIPVAPCPVPIKVEVSNAWRSIHGGGYFRSGNKHDDSYTVLFDLKQCDKKRWSLFRDSPSPVLEGLDG